MWQELKRINADIIYLQETYCTYIIEKQWEHEWGNKIIFNNGTSNANGVAILLNNVSEEKIIKYDVDNNGSIIIVDLKINMNIFTLINIYMPISNNDKDQRDIWEN